MRRNSVIRVTLLILAVGLIAAGLVTGEYRGVYRKASMICYECVGIG
ncbi:MAG: CD1871A family CXXC motif-containing protein [Acetatifactor sp.]